MTCLGLFGLDSREAGAGMLCELPGLTLRVLAVCLCCLPGFPVWGYGQESVPDSAGWWTLERAWAWFGEQPWFVGCNSMPSSAINQLEMFQAETSGAAWIDREFGLAAGLGFTTFCSLMELHFASPRWAIFAG